MPSQIQNNRLLKMIKERRIFFFIMNKDFDINAELNRTTVEGLKDINKEYNKRKKSDNTYFQT